MKINLQNNSINTKGYVIAKNKMPKFVEHKAYNVKLFVSSKPYNLILNYNEPKNLMNYDLITEKKSNKKKYSYTALCRNEADFIAHLHMADLYYEEKNKPFAKRIKDAVDNFIFKYILGI